MIVWLLSLTNRASRKKTRLPILSSMGSRSLTFLRRLILIRRGKANTLLKVDRNGVMSGMARLGIYVINNSL